MRRINLYVAGIILLFLCSACREEHIAPVNQLVKDLFCFKTGSEWMYYDSVSQTTLKMVITNYETFKSAPKSVRKTYDFAEYIIMCITLENITHTSFVRGETHLLSNIEQDNSLLKESSIFTPIEKKLSIGCDKNNKFSPSATYLRTYTINENTYSDVYVFNSKDNIDFYVSKHIGFIRCKKDNKYDFILIEKSVKQ